jgi:predicted DCC family thiol-disulfide oxidoreductase YuxK
MVTSEYILLFDRDCGICSALSRWIGAADLRHRIQLRTIQSSRELLRGIPDDRVFDAFHIVAPSGQLTTGGDAIPILIEALPMGAGFGRILRSSRGLMAQVHAFYRFLTRFREQLVCRVAFAGTSEGSPR